MPKKEFFAPNKREANGWPIRSHKNTSMQKFCRTRDEQRDEVKKLNSLFKTAEAPSTEAAASA